MRDTILVVIVAISLSTSTGCAMMDEFGANMARTSRMFRPRPFDEAPEPTEDVHDEWGEMMEEARSTEDRTRDPDRFFVEKVMSPQARDIERSLGFE